MFLHANFRSVAQELKSYDHLRSELFGNMQYGRNLLQQNLDLILGSCFLEIIWSVKTT